MAVHEKVSMTGRIESSNFCEEIYDNQPSKNRLLPAGLNDGTTNLMCLSSYWRQRLPELVNPSKETLPKSVQIWLRRTLFDFRL